MELTRLVLLLLPVLVVHAGWDNDWDRPLHFQCGQNIEGITSIVSEHNNFRHDRRFEFECTEVASGSAKCYWTHYVNQFDELVHFTCPQNYYINGMSSYHSNHHEDRRWKFRCCESAKLKLDSCTFTGWTNEFNRPQNFRIHHGSVLKGVVSMHVNHYEDRRFDFLVCKSEAADLDGWIDGRTDEEKIPVEEEEFDGEEELGDDVIDEPAPSNLLLDMLFGKSGRNETLRFA